MPAFILTDEVMNGAAWLHTLVLAAFVMRRI